MKRLSPIFSIAVNLILVTAAVLIQVQARAAQGSAIVDTAYVVEAVGRHAIIWDTRSDAQYRQGHLPGAVNIGSSWLGYGNTLDAPAEDVTFVNVGALQGKLGAMAKRVDALEKELAAMRAAR